MGSVATFFCNLGANLIVWDAERDKPLCRFIEGVCQTSDKRVIAKLKEQGYQCVDDGGIKIDSPDSPEEGDCGDGNKSSDLASFGIADLRKMAGQAKIKAYGKMSKPELVEALKAVGVVGAELIAEGAEMKDGEADQVDPDFVDDDLDSADPEELDNQ